MGRAAQIKAAKKLLQSQAGEGLRELQELIPFEHMFRRVRLGAYQGTEAFRKHREGKITIEQLKKEIEVAWNQINRAFMRGED
jgi:hypothetical protein